MRLGRIIGGFTRIASIFLILGLMLSQVPDIAYASGKFKIGDVVEVYNNIYSEKDEDNIRVITTAPKQKRASYELSDFGIEATGEPKTADFIACLISNLM